MAWLRVSLTEAELQIVNEEREWHPNLHVRRRMLALWSLHCGLTRAKAAEVAGISRVTMGRIVQEFRDGGLDGLRQWNVKGPTSELAAYRDLIREAFEKEPVRTVAEGAARIEKLTGLRRSPTQVRKFMKGLGMKWQSMRAVPLPSPKKYRGRTSQRSVGVFAKRTDATAGSGPSGKGTRLLRGCGSFCVWNISVLPVVLHAAVGTSRVGTAAIQRTGSLECHNPATDLRGEYDGREHRYDVRIVAEDCRPKSDRSDHGRAGQRPLSEERGGASSGHGPRHHSVVPAVVLPKSKPDRTTLEVHQTPGQLLWPLSPNIRRLSKAAILDTTINRKSCLHQPRITIGLAHDAEFSGIQESLIAGRVKYNPLPPELETEFAAEATHLGLPLSEYDAPRSLARGRNQSSPSAPVPNCWPIGKAKDSSAPGRRAKLGVAHEHDSQSPLADSPFCHQLELVDTPAPERLPAAGLSRLA